MDDVEPTTIQHTQSRNILEMSPEELSVNIGNMIEELHLATDNLHMTVAGLGILHGHLATRLNQPKKS